MGKIKNILKKELDRDIRRVKVEVYQDIKYVKTHIPKVIASFIVLIFFIILFVLFKTKQGDKFSKNTDEMLSLASTKDYIITSYNADKLLQDKTYTFVDIRTKKQRATGKIDGSKHIPFKQLLVQEHKVFWKNNNKKILVCDGVILSTQSWLLLSELGYKNIYILEGGMNYWKKYTASIFGNKPIKGESDEEPRYDFKKEMNKAKGIIPKKN